MTRPTTPNNTHRSATVRRLPALRAAAALAALTAATSFTSACSDCQSGPRQGPRLLADAGEGGCPHPLMPLVEGARWTYQVGDAEAKQHVAAELQVLEVTAKGRSLTAKVKRTVGPGETTVSASCTSDGTSFLALFVPLGPPLPIEIGYAPTITKRTGALLPPMLKLRPGADWNYDLIAHTEQPGGKALTLDSQWSVEAVYSGEAKVEVPAGRYDVHQVKLKVTGHHRPPAEEDVVFDERIMDPPPMEFTYSLARGVGVVLIEGEMAANQATRRARWALTKVDTVSSDR